MSFEEPLKTNEFVPEPPTRLPEGPLAPAPWILKVLVVPWASTYRVMLVPRKLIVVPLRPSAALNWTDVSLIVNTSVLPCPDSPLMVTVAPVPANESVPPPGIVPTGLSPRLTSRPVLPPLGVTTNAFPLVAR